FHPAPLLRTNEQLFSFIPSEKSTSRKIVNKIQNLSPDQCDRGFIFCAECLPPRSNAAQTGNKIQTESCHRFGRSERVPDRVMLRRRMFEPTRFYRFGRKISHRPPSKSRGGRLSKSTHSRSHCSLHEV